MKYVIRDVKSGRVFDMFDTREEAQKTLRQYERADKEDGVYEEDSYEIAEVVRCL